MHIYSCHYKCICPIQAAMFLQSCWSVFSIHKHSCKLNEKVQSFQTFREKCSEREKRITMEYCSRKITSSLWLPTQLFMKFVIRSLFRANSSNSKRTWSFRGTGSAAFWINVLYVQSGLWKVCMLFCLHVFWCIHNKLFLEMSISLQTFDHALAHLYCCGNFLALCGQEGNYHMLFKCASHDQKAIWSNCY